MSSEFDSTSLCETPRVIKTIIKEFPIEKSIAIDEFKLAIKKASIHLYPSELVDVLESYVFTDMKMDEITLKYENFRVVSDTEGLIGTPMPQPLEPGQSSVVASPVAPLSA